MGGLQRKKGRFRAGLGRFGCFRVGGGSLLFGHEAKWCGFWVEIREKIGVGRSRKNGSGAKKSLTIIPREKRQKNGRFGSKKGENRSRVHLFGGILRVHPATRVKSQDLEERVGSGKPLFRHMWFDAPYAHSRTPKT